MRQILSASDVAYSKVEEDIPNSSLKRALSETWQSVQVGYKYVSQKVFINPVTSDSWGAQSDALESVEAL